MTLTVVIATRGRPEILNATLQHFVANCELDSTKILVCVDSDDDATISHLAAMPQHPRMIYSVKTREDTRGKKYDRALIEAPADLYLVAVDHSPVLTKGYDRILLETAAGFPDGIGCVCTLPANASFPYLQAVTAKFAGLMGYIQPPQFPFWFIDHWLDDVARMTGRYAMADVVVDSSARPGKTTGLRDLVFWASYFDMLAVERREQANRIIDASDDPAWRKKMLKANFPMIEYRSVWINDLVRGEALNMQAQRGDEEPRSEGYLRALKAAVEDWQRRLPADNEQVAA